MFITPFLIGLASSLHCIGMCSPLVLAVSRSGRRATFRNVMYNGGRLITYGILGSVASLIGSGLDLAGIQQSVSLAFGAIIIVVAIANIKVLAPRVANQSIVKLISAAKARVRLNPFVLGMVNGILPCGMTLIALGYCITLPLPTDGFIAMMYFGLGTLPAMIGFSFITRSLIQRLPFGYRHIQTALLIISGVLLIGRAIDLHDHSHENKNGIIVCGASSKE